jgi:Lon protease-like protein
MFPLNAVLFPGVVVPLHVFEDRYRAMMRDLLAVPDPADRVFGVVAIREGYEVGDHGMQSAHRVGTLVQLTGVEPYDDGRFDIEVTGRQRLHLQTMHTSGEYFTAEVDLLDDDTAVPDDPEAAAAAVHALEMFERYRTQVLTGGSLGGDATFRGAVPDAADAGSVFYVNVDALEPALTKMAGSENAGDIDNLTPLRAVGMSVRTDGGVLHYSFKVTTD